MNATRNGSGLAAPVDDDVPESFAGTQLLARLQLVLDDVDFTGLRSVHAGSERATFRYAWCEPLNRFLDFLARNLKMSAAPSYHDAVKYLVYRLELGGKGRLEVMRGKHRIDLIDETGWLHEVKTREVKGHGELGKVVRAFLREVQRDKAGRETWWLGFLRECKDIKGRRCSTFLGLLRIPAAAVRGAAGKAGIDALVKELVAMVEDAELKVIEEENIDDDELDEGFLFGVENKVVKRLRKDYIAKDAENKKLKAKTEQLNAMLQETKTALQETKTALQETKTALQEKDAEIERLKADKGAVSKKPGKSLKDSP